MENDLDISLTDVGGGARKFSNPGQFGGLLAPSADTLPWPDYLTGQETKPVRVLLVDDDPFVRRVIAQELLGDLRIQLEGQADSIREGRKLLATHAFDVLMVDLRLSDGMGFELIAEARSDLKAVERAMQGLPHRHQDIFVALRVHELTRHEVAVRHGLSLRRVDSTLRQALQRLPTGRRSDMHA